MNDRSRAGSLKTSKALGLTIPPSRLQGVDQEIKWTLLRAKLCHPPEIWRTLGPGQLLG